MEGRRDPAQTRRGTSQRIRYDCWRCLREFWEEDSHQSQVQHGEHIDWSKGEYESHSMPLQWDIDWALFKLASNPARTAAKYGPPSDKKDVHVHQHLVMTQRNEIWRTRRYATRRDICSGTLPCNCTAENRRASLHSGRRFGILDLPQHQSSRGAGNSGRPGNGGKPSDKSSIHVPYRLDHHGYRVTHGWNRDLPSRRRRGERQVDDLKAANRSLWGT